MIDISNTFIIQIQFTALAVFQKAAKTFIIAEFESKLKIILLNKFN